MFQLRDGDDQHISCLLSTELAVPSPIYFGHDIEDQFVASLLDLTYDQLFVFVDEGVHAIYGKSFFERLRSSCGPATLIVVPPGESVKTFRQLEVLCEELIARGCSKRSILISFGGGS